MRGSLQERTDLFHLSHLLAAARRFGAAPSPASLTESQPNKTEISSFAAAAARQAGTLPCSQAAATPTTKERTKALN